jgi:phosphatidylglycerophosphate synthase
MHDPTARRPLKSRGTAWAQFFSRAMLRMGLTPNSVSLLSLVCAAIGGWATWRAAQPGSSSGWWLLAATGIQLRLFCNLMDGMLAVEGGLKSVTGELFNEIPDRIADTLILVPLGYATGSELGIALGWSAAVGAVFTAYVRALGATLLGRHDFCGPMAKPHRMAAATLGCLGMLALHDQHNDGDTGAALLLWTIGIINAGIVITSWRRITHVANGLREPKP